MTAVAVTVCGASLLLGSASAGAAVRASATPIQVGAIADEQTPCEEAGTGQIGPDTLRAWQSYVNKHGGITGHPVQLTILNSKCDPGSQPVGCQAARISARHRSYRRNQRRQFDRRSSRCGKDPCSLRCHFCQ